LRIDGGIRKGSGNFARKGEILDVPEMSWTTWLRDDPEWGSLEGADERLKLRPGAGAEIPAFLKLGSNNLTERFGVLGEFNGGFVRGNLCASDARNM
jgi:hypothetical protein